MQRWLSLPEIIVNKRTLRILIFVICILTLLLAVGVLTLKALLIEEVHYDFPVGEKSVTNPDRGFYIQNKSDRPDKIEKRLEEANLLLLAYDIYDYRDCPISDEKLRELETFLEMLKARDAKCIFRAAYGYDREEVNDADSLERIAEHIEQIAPILNAYSDQITCVQAGFFGPWGEWHSSVYLGDANPDSTQNRVWLTAQLLDAIDPEIPIALRRPSFLREAADAGIPLNRLCFHNDGLFASATDLGTYDDGYAREEELRWMEENLQVGVNGGEMPKVTEYSAAANAISEMRRIGITYLNLKYNEEVLEGWSLETYEGENALNYIREHLGYRYFLESMSYPERVKRGIFRREQGLRLSLRNDGFAAIGPAYAMEWCIEGSSGERNVYPVDPDALSTLKGDASMTFFLPAETLTEFAESVTGPARIGIRISRSSDGDPQDADCVEPVNASLTYEKGITWILSLDENGNLRP